MTRILRPVCSLLALALLSLSLLTGCGNVADGDGMVNTEALEKSLLTIYPNDGSAEYDALGEPDTRIDTSLFMGGQDRHIRMKALADGVQVSIYRVMYCEGFLDFCRFFPESEYSVKVRQGEVYEFAAYFPEYGYDYCLVAEYGDLRAEWRIADAGVNGGNTVELIGRPWEPQPVTEDSPMLALCRAHAIAACKYGSAPGYAEQPWYLWHAVALAMDEQLHYYGADGVQEVEEWIVDAYLAALFPDCDDYPAMPEGVGEYIPDSYAPYLIYPAMDDETSAEITDIRQSNADGTVVVTVEVGFASGECNTFDVTLRPNGARGADSPFEYGVVRVAVHGGKTLYGAASGTDGVTAATKPTNAAKPADTAFLPNLTAEHTIEMSNMMNNSWFVRDGEGTLCGRAFVNDMMSFVRNPASTANATTIEYECAPYALSLYGDEFYYIDAMYERYALYRRSNGEAEWLIGDVASYTIWNDVIYYTQTTDHYLRSYRLSDGQEGVVLNKAVFFPYAVDGWIVYQDDADGERIHAYRLTDGKDQTLTDEQSYCPIIECNTLWYVSGAEGCICMVDLESGEKFMLDAYTTQSFYLTPTNLYYYDSNEGFDEADDLPISIPREGGELLFSEAYEIPGDDNRQAFRYAEEYCYIAADYTDDWYYIERFKEVCDYYDGEIVSWLDISVG